MRAIAPDYANPTVLEGRMATRAALESALARSTVVHFAGHAVFDDERPERSHLVLAATGELGAGRITAAELAALDLRHVRVVVLSAYEYLPKGRVRFSRLNIYARDQHRCQVEPGLRGYSSRGGAQW